LKGVFTDYFCTQYYDKFSDASTDDFPVNHAVTVVGYNAGGSSPYWIIKVYNKIKKLKKINNYRLRDLFVN
jgi:hypothetical protein